MNRKIIIFESCVNFCGGMCTWLRLTPGTPDLVVWGSALARRFVSLNKELLFNTPVCLSSPRCINGYRQHTAGGGGGSHAMD